MKKNRGHRRLKSNEYSKIKDQKLRKNSHISSRKKQKSMKQRVRAYINQKQQPNSVKMKHLSQTKYRGRIVRKTTIGPKSQNHKKVKMEIPQKSTHKKKSMMPEIQNKILKQKAKKQTYKSRSRRMAMTWEEIANWRNSWKKQTTRRIIYQYNRSSVKPSNFVNNQSFKTNAKFDSSTQSLKSMVNGFLTSVIQTYGNAKAVKIPGNSTNP